MVEEPEKFAEVDKAQRERIESRNSLEDYAFSLKNDGLGGKIDSDDKEANLDAVKEATDWLDKNLPTAAGEDVDEQKEKLSNAAYPITSKLHSGGEGGAEGDEPPVHDDL
jgi:heat shock protein 5